jgi:SAM-dependent methyltransferase
MLTFIKRVLHYLNLLLNYNFAFRNTNIMKNLSDIEFWRTDGINHHRWPTGPVLHEGEDNVDALVRLVGDGTVRDIGCGYGRLATRFKPEAYTGYDICDAAVKKGTRMFPGYRFIQWNHELLLPADNTIAVSCLCCIDHQDIAEVIRLMCENTKAVILAENMDAATYYHNNPFPVYRRALEVYDQLLGEHNFRRTQIYIGVHAKMATIGQYYPFTTARWELMP